LAVQNQRYGSGLNRNLLKLIEGKPKFAQIIGGKPNFFQITESEICHEGLKPKNLQITRTKTKKKNYKVENRK